MTYKQLQAEMQTKQSKVFEDNKVFFAFSEKQVEEGKAKYNIAEDDKLCSVKYGAICPTSTAESYMNDYNKIWAWYDEEMTKLRANKEELEKAIRYELGNHECWYTGDIEPACELFPDVSREEVLRVYKKFASEQE